MMSEGYQRSKKFTIFIQVFVYDSHFYGENCCFFGTNVSIRMYARARGYGMAQNKQSVTVKMSNSLFNLSM